MMTRTGISSYTCFRLMSQERLYPRFSKPAVNAQCLTLSQTSYHERRLNYKAKDQLPRIFIKVCDWEAEKYYPAVWMTKKTLRFNLRKKITQISGQLIKAIMAKIKETVFNKSHINRHYKDLFKIVLTFLNSF